jgi:hypothetical protein
MISSKFSSRALLTEAEAVEIYSYKSSSSTTYSPPHIGKTASLSKKYNISPKAIRDIWNHRTWRTATRHMWTSDHPSPEAKCKVKNEAKRVETRISVDERRLSCPFKEDIGCSASMPLAVTGMEELTKCCRESYSNFHAISASASSYQQQDQRHTRETHNSRIDFRFGNHLEEYLCHKPSTLLDSQGNSLSENLYAATSNLHFPVHEFQLTMSQVLVESGPPEPSVLKCSPPVPPCLETRTMSCFSGAIDDPFHFDWPHW